MMNRIGRERGWPPSGRPEYEALRSPRGALAVGSPEQVAEKILFEHELFGMSRYVGQMSVGAVSHADVLRSMELFGTEVAPIVRAEVARREATPRGDDAAPVTRLIDDSSERYSSSVCRAADSHEYGPRAALERRLTEPRSRRRIVDQPLQRVAQRVGVAGGHEPSGAGRRDLRKAADVGQHDGLAERQRGREHAGLIEALGPLVREHDHVGAAKVRLDLVLGHVPVDEADAARRRGAQRRELDHRPADHPQLGAADPAPGVQQRADALVRAHQPEEQDDRLVDLVQRRRQRRRAARPRRARTRRGGSRGPCPRAGRAGRPAARGRTASGR